MRACESACMVFRFFKQSNHEKINTDVSVEGYLDI